MTSTLLIDLDDTLLTNDVDQFLEQYFKRLSAALAKFVEPERMMAAMIKAVQAMLSKKDPAGTMQDIFSQSFYPGIGVPYSELAGTLAAFYQDEFPQLKPLTHQRKYAIEFITSAIARGWQIAIATNPLFPATAINQRLVWAGLDPNRIKFAWVTNYSTAHFSKPNPAFYAEILAQLRWPEGPIVMVGNDFKDDIQPAEALGIQTFWLCEDCAQNHQSSRNSASGNGSYAQLETWLQAIELENTSPVFDSISAIKATLSVTPGVVSNFSKLLDPKKWNVRPQPSEWSFTEILCHLRDVDRDVNIPRIKSVQSGSNPFIPGAVTDTWVDERNYAAANGDRALQEFTEVRTELIHLLNSIAESEWLNPARHAIFGPTTQRELTNFIATHDRTHTQQIWQTIKAVGIIESAI